MLKPNAKPNAKLKKRTGPKLPPRPKLIIKPRPAAEPTYPLFAYKDRHDQMVARVHQSLERMKQASERGANLSIFSAVEEAVEAIFDNGVPPNRTWLVLDHLQKKLGYRGHLSIDMVSTAVNKICLRGSLRTEQLRLILLAVHP